MFQLSQVAVQLKTIRKNFILPTWAVIHSASLSIPDTFFLAVIRFFKCGLRRSFNSSSDLTCGISRFDSFTFVIFFVFQVLIPVNFSILLNGINNEAALLRRLHYLMCNLLVCFNKLGSLKQCIIFVIHHDHVQTVCQLANINISTVLLLNYSFAVRADHCNVHLNRSFNV